jgi:menaquinone-dependent protoporphyrinogen oxidase
VDPGGVGAGSKRQEAGSRKQEARGRKQEAGGRKQEARGRKQEARGRKQEAGGRKQEARGRKQEAGGRKQEARGRKQEARGRKQEARGRKQEAGSRRQEAGSRRQEAGSKRQEAPPQGAVAGVGAGRGPRSPGCGSSSEVVMAVHSTNDSIQKETTMSDSVLVAYATRYGSTQEVAEAVAATLRERGLEVAIQPMREVRALAEYSAVVLGAPLYMFRWHKDALQFLSRHREALTERPVAVFALGPFHDEEKEWQEVRAQLDKELAKYPWFTPVAVEIFGGKFDPAKLRFPLNLLPALRQMPASDVRDWAAIRAWASDLAAKLQPASS